MSTIFNAPTRKTAPIQALSNSYQSGNVPFPLPHIPSRQHQRLNEGTKLAIYIAGSRAHQHFLQPLGITAFQIGVTGRRNVDDRILDKRRHRYGSILMDPHAPEADAYCLMCGHDVCLARIWDEMLEGVAVPDGLAVIDGVIEVRLFPNITIEQADKRISRMLAPRSVNRYLETVDGQKRMAEAGYNTSHRLTTAYTDIGREPRYSRAEEIYLIRPKRELQALLDAVAAALDGCIQTI
jgi:hypothetical protein